MATPEDAVATQLKNIQARTGKTSAQLFALVAGCGLAKVSEQRTWLMGKLGLGYGDANTLVLLAKKEQEAPTTNAGASPLDTIYGGGKSALRPLHESMMKKILALGDFNVAPKKAYLSLRRKKQFAMVGPATKDQIEVGLNAKDLPPAPRLKAMPPGGMCTYTVRIATSADIDAELMRWVRTAYDAAG